MNELGNSNKVKSTKKLKRTLIVFHKIKFIRITCVILQQIKSFDFIIFFNNSVSDIDT